MITGLDKELDSFIDNSASKTIFDTNVKIVLYKEMEEYIATIQSKEFSLASKKTNRDYAAVKEVMQKFTSYLIDKAKKV